MPRVQILKKGGSISSSKAAEILHDGKANGKKLTDKQRRFMAWKAGNKAENGLAIEDDAFTPISDDTIMINGNSHKNGGTQLSYFGTEIEAEAGEPFAVNNKGEGIVFGNLKNPVTGNKFKSDAKKIAEKEAKTDKLLNYSTALINNSNPFDKWDSLKFNSGRAMATGAAMKKAELNQSKEQLGAIQSAILERSEELGVDPVKFANGTLKAKKSSGTAQNGARLSVAQRHNNPGNMKFAKWMEKYGATRGQAATDGGYFAQFPTVEAGQRAMIGLLKDKKYGNKDVYSAIRTWTNETPYENVPSQLIGKKVKDLNDSEFSLLLNTITQGEDSKKYNWDGIVPNNSTTPSIPTTPGTPYNAPRVTAPNVPNVVAPPRRRITRSNTPTDFTITPPTDYDVPTDAENFNYAQIIPELYAAATNREEPVFAQTYNPNLYQPYSISLQDRRNLNNQTFRAATQRLGDNAGAIATLAGQKYEADNQVNAEEFRINQGIQNDVINKNTQLLNDAQLKNLQIADTQYIRQSQARAKTKATNMSVLNSISGKLAQHELENRTLQTYENLYPHYRFGDDYRLDKVGAGGAEYINWGGVPPSDGSDFTSTRTQYDAQGNIKRIEQSIPSPVRQRIEENKLMQSENKTIQQLLKDGSFNYNPRTNKTTYSPLKGYDYSRF